MGIVRKIWRKLKKIYRKGKLYYYGHICPINKKKVFFSQFGGKAYGCNPKAICDEFLRRGGYDLVWLLNKEWEIKDAGIPEGVRVVRGDSAAKEMLTSKVWINNIHFNKLLQNGLEKRKGAIYLNTFHGGITLKNEGKDKHTYREKPESELSIKEKMYRKDAAFVDYITSGCAAERHVLEEFYYGHGEILMLGDARTDVLVNGSPETEQKVRAFYSIPEGTKIAIYAPTFRTDMKMHWYNMNYEGILDYLEERFSCPWVMLIRLHPRVADKSSEVVPDTPRFIDATGYSDMQELLVASDWMISDYSSVITDFMLSKKPAFMYVPDLDYYLDHRGMYFTMEELPFPYARTTEELIERMRQFDEARYQKKVEVFMEKIGCIADGKAAERIVDFLIEKMKE